MCVHSWPVAWGPCLSLMHGHSELDYTLLTHDKAHPAQAQAVEGSDVGVLFRIRRKTDQLSPWG